MHFVFVLLFLGGCTIKGTLSLTYPPPGWTPKPQPDMPQEMACNSGAKCSNYGTVDCGEGGYCKFFNFEEGY